jgi:transcription termination/antitermination protein NusG
MTPMAETQEPQAAPQPRHSGKAKWYIVHAYSNFEQKVAESIREQAGRQGLEEQFEDIQVPTEEVTEVVRGAKKVRQHRHFPATCW